MSDDEIRQKIEDLQKRWNRVSQDKAGVAGQLQAKKDELAAVVKEIKEAGYDPKHIAQERDQAKAELERMVEKLDADLTEVEKALETFKQR